MDFLKRTVSTRIEERYLRLPGGFRTAICSSNTVLEKPVNNTAEEPLGKPMEIQAVNARSSINMYILVLLVPNVLTKMLKAQI
jgi:hypothetical protein